MLLPHVVSASPFHMAAASADKSCKFKDTAPRTQEKITVVFLNALESFPY